MTETFKHSLSRADLARAVLSDLEAMANQCSAPMDLWGRFSNNVMILCAEATPEPRDKSGRSAGRPLYACRICSELTSLAPSQIASGDYICRPCSRVLEQARRERMLYAPAPIQAYVKDVKTGARTASKFSLQEVRKHYTASADGRVFRLGEDGQAAGEMTQFSRSKGYRAFQATINGQTAAFFVHRLVALVHIGDPPSSDHVVRHLDGNPSNNAVSNLSWGTAKENAADTRQHGRQVEGADHAARVKAGIERSTSAHWSRRQPGSAVTGRPARTRKEAGK